MSQNVKSAGFGALAFALTFGLVAATVADPAAARTTGAASASSGRDVPTKRVSVAGLDLTQASDLRQLDGRIRAASRRVCAEFGGSRHIMLEELSCRQQARAGAALKVAELVDRTRSLADAGASAGQGAQAITVSGL